MSKHNRRKKKSTKVQETKGSEGQNVIEAQESVEEEVIQDEVVSPKLKKESKEKKAFRLVKQSKEMLENAKKTIDQCETLLERDLKEFNDAKVALREGGLNDSMGLLMSLNCTDNKIEIDEPETVFASSHKEKPMNIKEISKARGKGFILALLSGLAVGIGLIYQATEKLGMTLNLAEIPSNDTTNDILSWFTIAVGQEPDATLGLKILLGAMLLTTIIVYVLFRSYKKRRNLRFSVKQFVEVELYIEGHTNCKESTNEIHEYLQSAIETLKTSQVLLFEQYGKLNRIFFIEGNKEKATEYNEKSFFEIQETKELIKSIIKFINLPIVKDGKLSKDSVLLLANSKRMNKGLIDRLK